MNSDHLGSFIHKKKKAHTPRQIEDTETIGQHSINLMLSEESDQLKYAKTSSNSDHHIVSVTSSPHNICLLAITQTRQLPLFFLSLTLALLKICCLQMGWVEGELLWFMALQQKELSRLLLCQKQNSSLCASKYFACFRGARIRSCPHFCVIFFLKLQSHSFKGHTCVIVLRGNKSKQTLWGDEGEMFSHYKLNWAVFDLDAFIGSDGSRLLYLGWKPGKSKIHLWGERVQASSCRWVKGQLLESWLCPNSSLADTFSSNLSSQKGIFIISFAFAH